MKRKQPRTGFNFIELVLVLGVLAIVGGVTVATLSSLSANSQEVATQRSLQNIYQAIMGNVDNPGYWQDLGQLPPTMADLFQQGVQPTFNPVTEIGWRGPYLSAATGTYNDFYDDASADYGDPNDPALLDGWGRPIVIQRPTTGTAFQQSLNTRAVSAGKNGNIDTPITTLTPSRTQQVDDIVIYLRTNP